MYHHNKMIAVLLGAVVFLPLVATGAEAPAKASAAKSPTPVTAIAQPRYEARTQSKPMKQGAVNAGGMLWQCRGTRCTATQPHGTPADACKALAREVGTLASFIFASKTFSSAELAQCRPPVRATTQNDTRSVARADKSKAESDKAPMTAPGVMPKAPQGFGIRTEPPDLRVTSLSQAGRNIVITVEATENANGMTTPVELMDAESRRLIWSGSATIKPLFRKHGDIVQADYRVPAGKKQRLLARVVRADRDLGNNSMTRTLGPDSAPLYVFHGRATATNPNSLAVSVPRRGANWIELLVRTTAAAEHLDLRVEPEGVPGAECIASGGYSSSGRSSLVVPVGSESFRFRCQAGPQNATGAVRVKLARGSRMEDSERVPWTVRPPAAGAEPASSVDLAIVRGEVDIVDELPGRVWVRIRNNGPRPLDEQLTVGWSVTGRTGLVVASGSIRQRFALASGAETTIQFPKFSQVLGANGRRLTWRSVEASRRTNIRASVRAVDVIEPDERNNVAFIPVTHPMFGSFALDEVSR